MKIYELLSVEDVKNLNKVAEKSKKMKKSIRNKPNNDLNKSKKIKKDIKTKSKFNKNYKDVDNFKRKTLRECYYCGTKELELTANGYYYCVTCGIKVEKAW